MSTPRPHRRLMEETRWPDSGGITGPGTMCGLTVTRRGRKKRLQQEGSVELPDPEGKTLNDAEESKEIEGLFLFFKKGRKWKTSNNDLSGNSQQLRETTL